MKGIIFENEKEAKEWDFEHNEFNGNITKYKWSRKVLEATSTMPKAEYAEWKNIPQTITTGYNEETMEAITEANPEFEALDDNVIVNKVALIVEDDLDLKDEEGNLTGYKYDAEVVDVSGLLKVVEE